MVRVLSLLLLLSGLALIPVRPATAQGPVDLPVDLPVDEVLALVDGAYLGRNGAAAALRALFPALSVAPDADGALPDDPFFWSLEGRFGLQAPGSDPGTIFHCARYGLATRDWFAEQGFATRASVALMGLALPLHDDGAQWPEGAVARLHCSFLWDDAEVVAILRPDAARAALAAIFPEVSETTAAASASLLGPDGFVLQGQGGADGGVVQGRSATITLTLGHQQVTFRSFLMGGGS